MLKFKRVELNVACIIIMSMYYNNEPERMASMKKNKAIETEQETKHISHSSRIKFN